MTVRSSSHVVRRTLTTAAAFIGAAFALTAWPTPAEPIRWDAGPDLSRAALPTPVDPSGPNSGVGRLLASRPTVGDPTGPNSGAGLGLS